MANIGPTYTGPAAGQGFKVDVDKLTQQPKGYVDPQKAINKEKKKNNKTGFDKAMDVDFDYGWQIHDQDIQMEIDNYRNKIAGWYKRGGDMNDPDFARVVKAEQDRIGLHAKRSEYMKEKDAEARTIVKGDDEYLTNEANKAITGVSKDVDENGNIISGKKAFDMEEEEYETILGNSEYFDQPKVWQNAALAFDDIAHTSYKENFYTTGTKTEVETWSGKLINEDGSINLGEAQKKVLYGYPKAKQIIDQQRDAGVKEEKIWEDIRTMMEANRGVKRSVTRENKPEWMVNGTKDGVTIDRQRDTRRKTYVKEGEKTRSIDQYVAEEYNVLSKNKIDREVPTKALRLWDEEAGEFLEGTPGDTQMQITSIQLRPWNYKGEPRPNVGQTAKDLYTPPSFRFGEKQQLWDQQLDNKDAGVQWMAQGTITYLDQGETITKKVMVPYDDVKDTLKRKTGFTLENRGFEDYTSEELVDHLRRNAREANQPSPTRKQIQTMIKQIRDGQTAQQ